MKVTVSVDVAVLSVVVPVVEVNLNLALLAWPYSLVKLVCTNFYILLWYVVLN